MAKRRKVKLEMKAVACPGEAHRNPHIDYCMVCLGGKWGEVQIPACFPDLHTYQEGAEILLKGAAADSTGEIWDLHDCVRNMWEALTPEGKAEVWGRLKAMRQRHAEDEPEERLTYTRR